MSPVGTVFTFDFMMYVTSVVLRLRVVAVDQQRKVGEPIELESVVEISVIQAVFVSRTRLAEVRQLIQVI